MKFQEKVDINKLKYLQTLSLEEFINCVSKEDDVKVKNKKDREGEFKYFKYFVNDFVKNNGCKTRTYVQNEERGRYYCHTSIQARPNAIRGFLLDGIGTDIDMVNCHPTILRYICSKNEILCPNLEYYVKNRSTIIKANPNIKYEVISYINGSTSRPTTEFMKNIKQECKNIQTSLLNLPKFKGYLDYAVKCGKNKPVGTAMFSIMEDMEVDIILKVKEYLTNKKIDIIVFMHDGLLVNGNHYNNEGLLKELEDLTEREYEGLGMKYSYKEHSTKIKIPEDFEPDNVKEQEEEHDYTDDEVARYIFDKYRNKILNNNDILYVYYKHQWTEKLDEVFRQWFSTCDLNTKRSTKVKPVLVKSQTTKWPHYITQLKCICTENLDSVDILDTQKDILPFMNGYYDFVKKQFIKHNDEDVLYFTYRINRVFPERNQADINEINKVMMSIFDDDYELMDEVFKCIARSLGNNVQDKVGLCLVGERNSAKGFIAQLLMNSLKGVVGSIISNDLVAKKGSFEAAERRNGFLKGFCENLLCISEEVDPEQNLDGTMWKTIVSGGDKVSYRTAYGSLTSKTIKSLYLITCNKSPVFNLQDARETMLLCNMPCKFYETMPEDGFNRGFTIKQADPEIKVKFNKIRYLDAFIHFLIDYYQLSKPKYPMLEGMNMEDLQVSDTYVDTTDALHMAVNKCYTINTLKQNDKIKAIDVNKRIIDVFKEASSQKVKKYLQSRGVIIKKINGYYYYYGIKEVVEDNESSMFV